MPTWSSSMRRRLTPRSRAAGDDRGRPARHRGGDRVEELAVHHLDAALARGRRPARSPSGARAARSRAAPRARGSTAYIDAITASRTCAVQMFDVAFSRRMCCSRVCRASRYAGAPSASFETPTSRPGSCRSKPCRTARYAGVRAAEAHRHAEPLGRCRPRRRRRVSPGGAQQASGPAGPRRRPPPRRARARRRSRSRGRAPRPTRPGRTAAPRRSPRRGRARSAPATVLDDQLDAERLGPGPEHGEGLRQGVLVDDERGSTPTCRRGAPASSPRRPRWPRRAATRSRRAARSGPRPWSGS